MKCLKKSYLFPAKPNIMAEYYYHNGTDKVGPLSLEALKAHNLTPETYVWYEGLTDWKKAGEVTELVSLFSAGGQAAAPQPAAPQAPQPGQPQQGYAQPQPAYQYGQRPMQPHGAYSQQAYQQPYQQAQQPAQQASSSGAKPKLGVLKVFGIIGLLISIVLIIMGIAVANMSAYCWDYDCDCYPVIYEKEPYAIIFVILGVLFLTQSIITMVKAFKKY